MKKILVVDNYDSFVFNIVQLLRESPEAVDWEVVRNDAIDFSRLRSDAGILISPGPGLPVEAGELLPLIEYCKNTHPMLGICLGHQAIAEVFGASLSHLSAPLHGHRSALRVVDPRDLLLNGLEDPVTVGRYHSWVVAPETMPADLRVSSFDEQEHIMSFYHVSLPIHGIQFHPESCISSCGREIMANWLASLRKL